MPLAHTKNLPVRISDASHTPVFQQIASQIYCIIALGQLSEGALLPQIRSLAAQLEVNPNTVARAYQELASRGMVRKRQGSGCYVASSGSRELTRGERLKPLLGRIEELAADAQKLGVSLSELIEELKRHGPTDLPDVPPHPEKKFLKPAPLLPTPGIPSPPVSLWQPADTLLD